MAERIDIKINDDRGWDVFVSGRAQATNYHLLKWRAIVSETFGHQAYYLSARKEDGTIRGILPLVLIRSSLFGSSLVSLPFFNYGGLICDDAETEQALLEEGDRIMREVKADHMELRHRRDAGHALVSRTHKATLILDLEASAESQWRSFDPKLRNQIRKAERSGLKVVIGRAELIDQFYRIFAINMRDLGTPVYPKSLFTSVLKHAVGTSNVFIISSQDKPVAVGISTSFGDTFELPWAASLRSERRLCPNDILYWGCIRYAIENGFRKFDFGRSTVDTGPFHFKKQWGPRVEQLWWQYRFVGPQTAFDLSPANPSFGRAVRIWQRLPVWLTRFIGPRIVKYLP